MGNTIRLIVSRGQASTHYEICDLFQWANRRVLERQHPESLSLRKQDQLTTQAAARNRNGKAIGAALTCITPTGLKGVLE